MGVVSGSRLLASLIIALAQLGTLLVLPTGGVAAQTATIQVVPNRYIVVLNPSTAITSASVAAAYDARPGVEVTQVYTTAIRGFAAELDARTARELAADPNVAGVFPDVISEGAAQTRPVGIDRVDADLNPVVAGNNSGAVNADVAVIDSGVANHPDLNLAGGIDCTGTGSFLDDHGHGTHVAGTVAARDNNSEVVGVAPGARIWAVKVLHSDNFGSESEIICGLDWVAANAGTIEVANMSIQGYYGDLGTNCAAHPYHQAVCSVVGAGVTVVVAAGNGDQFNNPIDAREVVPAQFNEVITVSAFYDADGAPGGFGGISSWGNGDDTMAPFSNYGPDIDLAAPGVDVLSLNYLGGPAYTMSGTSMASPHVAGAAALIRVQQGISSPSGIKARLLLAGRKGPVPGDLDSFAEPDLNVARLGPGSMTAPASGTVGLQIVVTATDCIPGSRLLTRFDGVFMGGTTTRVNGTAVRRFKIPSAVGGGHTITASCEQRSFAQPFSVQPSLRLSPISGVVDDTVSVSLRGFQSGESVLITFDTGPAVRTPVRITMSGTGAGNGAFVVPTSVGGTRTVTAEGSLGTTLATAFTVEPTLRISDSTLATGEPAVLTLRGFQGGEVVEFHWDSPGGDLLGTKTATSTGSGTATINLPPGPTEGNHTIYAIGDIGTERQVNLSFSATSLPETPTPAASPEPSVSPESTPTAEPTIEQTEPASPEPVETESTDSPTEVPSETATTEPPTETATIEGSTETPEPT